jgi:hypothetical protein
MVTCVGSASKDPLRRMTGPVCLGDSCRVGIAFTLCASTTGSVASTVCVRVSVRVRRMSSGARATFQGGREHCAPAIVGPHLTSYILHLTSLLSPNVHVLGRRMPELCLSPNVHVLGRRMPEHLTSDILL